MKETKRPQNSLKLHHPRLAMFYNSSVLNMLMVWLFLSLLIADWDALWDIYPYSLIVCGLVFAFAVGYALWFWIRKPSSIPVCGWLSDVSGIYTIYFLIVCAVKSDRLWWNLFALVAAIAASVIYLIKGDDECCLK